MKKEVLFIFACAASIFGSACSPSQTHEIAGIIDEKTRDDLLKKEFSKIKIKISSPGGKGGPSIEIAEFLSQKEVTFDVSGVCNSACSQILLPVGETINFIDNPFVGFHQSLTMEANFFRDAGGDITKCPIFENLVKRETGIQTKNNLNPDFWKEVESRLIPKNFKLVHYENDPCLGYDYEFEHFIWYPTSKQLQEKLGLKFNGSVCADDFTRCIQKIEELSQGIPGSKIVIGDRVHVF